MADVSELNEELLAGFIDESMTALQGLQQLLEQHRAQPQDAGPINSVFRAVHSIKGNAGFFGLTAMKKFAHSLENTLDEIRAGKLVLSESLQRTLVEGFDLLDGMLQTVSEGRIESELGEQENELLARVHELCNFADPTVSSAGNAELSRRAAIETLLAEMETELAAANNPQAWGWAARWREACGLQQPTQAIEEVAATKERDLTPQQLLQTRFGDAHCDISDAVHQFVALFVENATVTKSAGQSALAAAEAMCEWAAKSGREELKEKLNAALGDFRMIQRSPLDLDANLLSMVWEKAGPVVAEFRQPEVARATIEAEKKVIVDSANPAEEVNVADKSAEASDPKAKTQPGRLVRVKEEKLDEFLDDVSSLFITCERLKDLHSRMTGGRKIEELVEELRQINATFSTQAKELQHSVVSLRKVPIQGLLGKFPRVARSLANSLGKQLNVHVTGGDVEIDKTLIEDLDAPLMHMVRNVADHAIELPEVRRQRGVDEAGNLWLKAEQTRTHIIITVQDDGRGLDASKLRDKAVQKGLITRQQADAMSVEEAFGLIFAPGFSTAEQVSDVSGRGVGMDVVLTNLREHNGEIKIQSKLGQGTTFRMEIPVRQAVVVLDGLVLEENGSTFVVPFEHLQEICELKQADLRSVHGKQVAMIRGQHFAAEGLSDLLDLESNKATRPVSQAVLLNCRHGSLCLLVQRIVGQRKVVINSLQNILPGVDKIAGVAQLGGGRLALVLSPSDIIKGLKEKA